VRAGASLLLLFAVLAVSGCGASHRAETKAVATRKAPAQPHYTYLALTSRSGKILRRSNLAVSSAVSDGRDGWYVNGAIGLAHLLSDGRIDSSWGTPESRKLGCSVGCRLVKFGSRLYVAGQRSETVPGPGGETRVSVVEAFDAGTGARLWVGPSPSQDVYALAASSTRVYIGGAFTSVGNVTRHGFAALDAETGRLLDWRGPRISFDPPASAAIFALTLDGPRLYLGGTFLSIGGRRQFYLAALNPATGALLSWKPPQAVFGAYYPMQILVTRGQLIIPGYDGFFAASLRTGRKPSWLGKIRGSAGTVTVDGSLLYLGANIDQSLSSVDGARRNNLAAIDLATGRATSWAPNLAPYVDVGAIVPSGGRVLVVGSFTDSIG
jgi:hypothetical protein